MRCGWGPYVSVALSKPGLVPTLVCTTNCRRSLPFKVNRSTQERLLASVSRAQIRKQYGSSSRALCGSDVHQASLAVCVAIKEEGKSEKHRLRCGTTSAELLRLSDWLHSYPVTQVAMEATGVYWKPVWHILEG